MTIRVVIKYVDSSEPEARTLNLGPVRVQQQSVCNSSLSTAVCPDFGSLTPTPGGGGQDLTPGVKTCLSFCLCLSASQTPSPWSVDGCPHLFDSGLVSGYFETRNGMLGTGYFIWSNLSVWGEEVGSSSNPPRGRGEGITRCWVVGWLSARAPRKKSSLGASRLQYQACPVARGRLPVASPHSPPAPFLRSRVSAHSLCIHVCTYEYVDACVCARCVWGVCAYVNM